MAQSQHYEQIDGPPVAPRQETKNNLEKGPPNQQDINPTSTSTDKPNLFTLPRELRDMIYEYTFTGRVDLDDTATGAALLCTCKQAYIEGLGAYYQNSTFSSEYPSDIIGWVRKLSPQKQKLIKAIHWEHSYRASARSSKLSFRAFSINSKHLYHYHGKHLAEGVYKTFFLTAGGETVWYSLKPFAHLSRWQNEDLDAFKKFADTYGLIR